YLNTMLQGLRSSDQRGLQRRVPLLQSNSGDLLEIVKVETRRHRPSVRLPEPAKRLPKRGKPVSCRHDADRPCFSLLLRGLLPPTYRACRDLVSEFLKLLKLDRREWSIWQVILQTFNP